MTLKQIEELEALAATATPGPWWVNEATENYFLYTKAENCTLGFPELKGDDAWFIAASREAVPALCQALRETREHIVRLLAMSTHYPSADIARTFLKKFEDKSEERE